MNLTRKSIGFLMIVALFLNLTGCFWMKKPASWKPLIAILPFDNESVVLEAPDLVREALFKRMKKKKFDLVELDVIDTALKKMGISEGGQLPALSLEDIKKEIPADWYCYGNVSSFAFKSLIAISQRAVEVDIKVVEGKTGRILHEDTRKDTTTRFGTAALGDLAYTAGGKMWKPVKDGVKKSVPGKPLKKVLDATDKIADVDLTRETKKTVKRLLKRFPRH